MNSPCHWLREVMERAGVDTSVFKAHSIRGASTSAALDRGGKIFLLQQTGAGRTLSGDSIVDRKSYEEQHLLTKSWHLNNSLSAKRVLSHCYNGHFLEQLYL